MKNKKYYVGFDIGTDSVGYAVTDERYELLKYKGEPMWGVTLFDEAQLAAQRRTVRAARRRLDRRQQRVKLIQELFASEIYKIDKDFYKRIKTSYLFPEDESQKIRLFGSYKEQKAYDEKYPTIHHLILELMNSSSPHDPRLIYIACAWMVAHRGHFLSEVDKQNIDAVTDFKTVWKKLNDYITREEYAVPWKADVDLQQIEDIFKKKLGVTKKSKLLSESLFANKKAPKEINESYEYNYDIVIKLLCGGKDSLQKLFGKDEYADLEEKSVALNMDDEKISVILQTIDENDAEFISIIKSVYDWSVLVDVLKGKKTISEAKVEVYNQHKNDLTLLKSFIKKYSPEKYSKVFRSETESNNYAAYIGKNKTANEKSSVKKSVNKEDFCKYILSIVKSFSPEECDVEKYSNMISRLEVVDFLPIQVEGDNRVIPYQLYWYELNKILENSKSYIPFLNEVDEDGISGAQKVLSVFEFRVPYYVGPLKEKSNPKFNHWMVRKAQGKIYPWNFEKMVDLDESEDAFIKRMTNSCTYLPGEDVLPKNSLVYCAFEVLNEINNIKINDAEIPVSVKQSIYENVFMEYDRVSLSKIKNHLESLGFVKKDEYKLSGLDQTVKSTLKPFRDFKKLVEKGLLTYSEVEKIINRATYSEDKNRFSKWVKNEYSNLPESEIKYISNLKFKGFGRLSRKLLCGIEGAVNKDTGEYMTIIRTMWETNFNFMQLLTDQFDFSEHIRNFTMEYYDGTKKSLSDKLDERYISNAVKRQIIRTFDILNDIKKVQKTDPEMIFIEMARGATEDQKKRKNSRLDQIKALYEKIDEEEVRELNDQLESWGDTAHNKLQSDKIFLYFTQLGKCLYSGEKISLESVLAGDGSFNVEHIYPRSFVKDDSVLNNKILVNSVDNEKKGDSYPIAPYIQDNMRGYWANLHKIGLIGDEKYKRLTRTTPFTEDEKYEFINRQLVETRQSTKAVASLLKELYPDTEIVYVKAELASDFRRNFKQRRFGDENYQEFDLPKARSLNDLHHAKDAYLNIVVGNVWYHKFNKRYYLKDADNNQKPEIIFTRTLKIKDDIIWDGIRDKERVVKIARKNNAHMNMYSYCNHSGQNGGFFDQKPKSAKKGLIPLKKGMPTEIYGGYDKATVSGFVLARYTLGKKVEVSFVPVKLLDLKKFVEDDSFAKEYVSREFGEKAKNIEILLNKRIIKIFTMISLDGARFCIRGKANPTTIGLMNMMPFKTSLEFESYIKKLESFEKKKKKNDKIIWDEKYDGISLEKNKALYMHYIEKMSKWPYNKRPGISTLMEKLQKRINDFEALNVFGQVDILLQIQGIFGRIKQADLNKISESPSSGTISMSLNLSNWKKAYDDVRIIDQSASGLYESVSDNLLELL